MLHHSLRHSYISPFCVTEFFNIFQVCTREEAPAIRLEEGYPKNAVHCSNLNEKIADANIHVGHRLDPRPKDLTPRISSPGEEILLTAPKSHREIRPAGSMRR
jgi:hypothetical protein